MTSKNFFKQLKAELQNHPYRDRYLEELKAHAEDLEKDANQSNQKLTDEIMKKRMGDPKAVKENFLNIMHPFRQLFFVLEGLFYGFLFIPVTLFSYFNLRSEFYYIFSTGYGTFHMEGIIGTFFTSLLAFFVLYFFSYKRFLKFENKTDEKKRWMALIFFPGLITIILNLFFDVTNEFGIELGLVGIIFIFLSYLLINFLASQFAWKLNESKLAKNIILAKIIIGFKIIGSVYVALCLLYRTFIPQYLGSPNTLPDSIAFFNIFSPLYYIEVNLGRAWTGLMNSSLDDVNLFMAFFLPLLLLLFLTAQSLWVIVSQKKWFSVRFLIVLYVVSLFFISPQPFIKKPDFKVPYIHISEVIEKKQVGMAYPILKYFNARYGSLFKYEVGIDDLQQASSLIIKSNSGEIYYPEWPQNKNIEKISYSDVIFGKFQSTSEDNLKMVNLPDDYECKDSTICGKEDFANQHIWNEPSLISDAVFSEDGKWGLLVIPNLFSPSDSSVSPVSQEVYLVELKK